MQVNESIENYLEAILKLRQTKGFVRSIDVASELGVTKPSVSHATKLMRENSLIIIEKDGDISLTDEGNEIASRIYERHKTLAGFFMSLGVSEENAFKDACKIEHDISEESFRAICRLAESGA